ncbi:hypothetical protein PHYSODRAFT_301126 [Phytophthora sojae]|uniref:Uncharacterized protein n=1 Tax=Phytophthora sojae (strain P6497) TaxID=1094619 RepID=G4ZF41_PHYSP|nr:hypothetical protein PHYSODRAFT_301126 [Phytophthora sojae]EGZ18472.1 hypothetical protein PHYSODRAFT_301126 [Phytophthora sojae]|eukprot:XP_009527530.1 hypothetical protein PHYSODRAFT_301126 [Phytophthora sojae]
MLYGLHKRTGTLLSRLHQHIGIETDAARTGDSLLAALSSLCRDPEKFERQLRPGIRVYSCLPHEVSRESKDLLEKLAKISYSHGISSRRMSYASSSGPSFAPVASAYPKRHLPWARNRVEAIQPIVASAMKRALPPPSSESFDVSKRTQSSTTHRMILQENLEALFSMECLVVTAYLEAATPVLYCCYVLVMVHLPSARYHAEMAGVTMENVGSKILFLFIFGLLQIASFVLLVAMVKR